LTRVALALFLFASFALFGCSYAPYVPARAAPALAQAPGVERGQDLFKGSGGITLFEQWWRPTNRPVRGAVAIIHGLKDHSSRYNELATRLAQEGSAVYAMDLRGHGHSEGVRVDVADFDDYCKDVDLFLGRIRQREPGKPLFVFGHSMGGAIVTLDLITRKPELAGVVLSGAALAVDVSGVKVVGTKVVAAISPDAGIFNLDLHEHSRDPKVVETGLHDPLVYQEGAPARTAKNLLNAIDTIQARMGEVNEPLLILHGGADTVTPPQGSKDLYARASSKDKTLKIYDGYFHDLMHDTDHQRVVDDIASFIDRREPR
jgi:alpha-beta hydrolase superfamily lysophospholipase